MKTELSKSERRIAIVEDAILQLKLGAYKTGEFGYVKLPSVISKIEDKELQAQDALLNISNENYCGVCAKGSLFLSAIRKENNLKLEEIDSSFEAMKNKLTEDDLFSEHNINLIEVYYENWRVRYWESSSGWVLVGGVYDGSVSDLGSGFSQIEAEELKVKYNSSIEEWNKKFKNVQGRTELLIAILNNMISNEGIFKPLE